MKNKFVASLMTALMAAMTLAAPALAATALNTYPTFLGKSGDFYVVVGEKAATSDVAGAIDIASNLAQLSYRDAGTTSTSSVDGIERKIAIPTSSSGSQVAGTGSNNLPTTLRNFHFSGLKDGQIEYLGTKYSYHEQVVLPTSGTDFILTHSLASYVNGTLKMRLDRGIEYQYKFDTAIPAGSLPTSANSSTYSNPLVVQLAGKEFRIVALPTTTSFSALVGSVEWVTQGSETGIVAGDLTAVVDTVYLGTQAAIRIVDKAGNTVTNLGVVGTSTKSFTYGGSTYNIKVLQTATVTVAGAGENRAQILFGKGEVEKTFDGSTTSTISDWVDNWKIGATGLAGNGGIATTAALTITYSPNALTDAERYQTAGYVFKGPGDYFEIGYAGYTPNNFATVTVQDSGSVTLYESTATGAATKGNIRGLKITTDAAGSIVRGSTGYSEVYVLFSNATRAGTQSQWSGTYYYLAYKDATTGRIVAFDSTYFDGINITNADESRYLIGEVPATAPAGYGMWNFTLSYGGPGATAQYLVGGMFNNQTLLNGVAIWNLTAAGARSSEQVNASFQNRTAASASSPADFIVGTTSGTSSANDVRARIESATLSDVSQQIGELISDGGTKVYSVKSNIEGNRLVVGIPPETVYGLVQFGKVGPTTTGGTIKEVVAITTVVAKLDREITSTDKANKNLVLVGGPCANTLVDELVKANKIDAKYACSTGTAWKANTAYIIVADDAFATGKKVVVIAGTEAADTRLASTVAQQYATKLTGVTGSTATITGTAIATATIS